MPLRVLVTRPEPGASRTASRLTDLGCAPVVLPLTEIVGLPVDPLDTLPDAVALTSANALRHAPEGLIGQLRHIPCFAIGEETAGAARRRGFAMVIAGQNDAGMLASELGARNGRGSDVLYLCGQTRTMGFEEKLTRAGLIVRAVETYAALRKVYDAGLLAGIVGPEPIDAVLLYSARAADLFVVLPWPEDGSNVSDETRYLCLSPQIAGRLPVDVRSRAKVATAPTDAALMRLVAEHGPASFQRKLV